MRRAWLVLALLSAFLALPMAATALPPIVPFDGFKGGTVFQGATLTDTGGPYASKVYTSAARAADNFQVIVENCSGCAVSVSATLVLTRSNTMATAWTWCNMTAIAANSTVVAQCGPDNITSASDIDEIIRGGRPPAMWGVSVTIGGATPSADVTVNWVPSW